MWLTGLYRRVRALLRSEAIRGEIDEEMRFHIDMRAEENVRRGMSPEQARREAELRFGGLVRAKELGYEVRGGRWLETLWQDCRYGARSLRKSPGFTAAALVTLALGIGATASIFSVVNAVLLRPLPYEDPGQLITPVGGKNDSRASTTVSYPDFSDWRDQAQTLEAVAAYSYSTVLLRRDETEPDLLYGANVSADLFPLLRVRPAVGRAFTREEERVGAAPVILISHAVWQSRFNADPNVVGQPLNPGAMTGATIIGVLPAGFRFPAQANRTDFLRPLAPALGEWARRRGAYSLRAVARLQPGATVEQAEAEMRLIGDRLARQHPEEGYGLGTRFVSLHESVIGDVRTPLLVLLGAVGLLLLIACANVANLMLARASARQREIAVRAALGASRWRITRQLLTESTLLALTGGALGLLAAVWGVDLLTGSAGLDIPRLKEVSLDSRVLAFTLGITVVTAAVFGLAPALQAGRIGLQESLKEGGRGGAAGPARSHVRSALVISEVALSLVLLVGAGLLVKSFVNLTSVEPGFDARGVLTTSLSLSKAKYPEPEQQRALFAQIVERLRAVPGVESAALIYPLPFGGSATSNSFLVVGRPAPPPADRPSANYRAVSPDYFHLMRTPLSRGRAFTDQDGAGAPPVAVVNETFARRFFPGQDPLGERVVIERAGGGRETHEPREIVGVVGDVRHTALDEEGGPEFYVPYQQAPESYMGVVVRAAAGVDSTAVRAGLRDAIRAADTSLYVPAVEPMTGLIAESVAGRRFNAVLTALFASVALVLAAVGIYGVTAYTVAQRTHEIGVRMALGARPRDVLRLVVRQGSRLLLLGLGIGLAASLITTRVLAGMLFKVTPTDPATLAFVTLGLSIVALLACYVPARRATKVDPLIALKAE